MPEYAFRPSYRVDPDCSSRRPMPELPEHEERYVRDYVNTQSPQHDQARLVQKIGSRRIMGRVHEMYDVHCEQS